MLVSSQRNAHFRWIRGLGTPECSFCLNRTLNSAFMLKTSIMRREPSRALEKPPRRPLESPRSYRSYSIYYHKCSFGLNETSIRAFQAPPGPVAFPSDGIASCPRDARLVSTKTSIPVPRVAPRAHKCSFGHNETSI